MIRATALTALMSLFLATECAAISVVVEKYSDAACGQALGTLNAVVMGGTPPYTVQWSNGATTEYIEFLPAGMYTVTVTDGIGDMATGSGEILVTASHQEVNTQGFSGLVHCPGDYPYTYLHLEDPHNGPEPHNVTSPAILYGNFTDHFGPFPYSYIGVWMDVTPGTYNTINWTDAAGCPGSTTLQFSTEWVEPNVSIVSVQGACNGSNGRINMAVSGAAANQAFRVNVRTLDGQIPPNLAGTYGSRLVSSNSTFTFPNLAAGAYWVITDPDMLGTEPNDPLNPLFCVDSMYVEVPDLLGQCALVSGSIFLDHDQDCAQDPGDSGLGFRLVEFLPGPYYALANPSGNYGCYLANGSYTMNVSGTGSDLYPVCPPVQPIPVTVGGVNQIVNVADSSLIPLDLEAELYANAARPGFVQNLWALVEKPSGVASGLVDATLTFDPQMGFIDATPPPTSVSGNVVSWIGLPAVPDFGRINLHIQLQVPADVLLIGQPFSHSFSISQPIAEIDLANNTTTRWGTITGSYDPNDKTARTSSGSSESAYLLGTDEWIDYTIRFQNTGTDTAFTVVVRDVLPAELDMGTFEQGLGSHPFTVSFMPGRKVEWHFDNILLPDSGTNEAASHGVITFRIRPVNTLLPGTEINNIAGIYFDFNPPVITEPSMLVAEFSTGVGHISTGAGRQLEVYPNPSSDHLRIISDGAMDVITILAADGREVMRRSMRSSNGTIDISWLSSGTYVLFAVIADGTVVQNKFVKY
ncbi:MAG TPA: T9SS type A sorting domain-containing protein [Flavobacteriales bacterium]|mgnify:CR=1 FL=1|nr:T9SS type A sorting domain-containing protein [Flavobacteriales bacterium]